MTSKNVNLVGHPLVQHKLSLMRDKGLSTKGFRELLNEIGMLLCYEVTRDLPLEMVDIDTPLAAMKAPKLAGKKLTLAPILRASRISASTGIRKRFKPWNTSSRRHRICRIAS